MSLRTSPRLLLGPALAALLACGGGDNIGREAVIEGTHDMAIVGNQLFVTSSDRNELRVLDLSREVKDWVRAPNPIEPLAIPVVDNPTHLARDLRLEADALVAGPYLYAFAAGGSAVSVIWADPYTNPEALVERCRFEAGAPLTAAAGAGKAAAGEASILYFATLTGTQATVRRITLPAPVAGQPASVGCAPLDAPFFDIPALGESVSALAVVGAELWVATRGPGSNVGRVVALDAVTLAPVAKTIDFGAPVRMLRTHGRAVGPRIGGQAVDVLALTHVFGVLDEEACGLLPACSGVVAVNASDGQVSNDYTGQPMTPIRPLAGLVNGLELAPSSKVNVSTTAGIQERALWGILTATNGQVLFFDAIGMTHENTAAAGVAVSTPALHAPDGGLVSGTVAGLTNVAAAVGAARVEEIRATFEGVLPGLDGVQASVAGAVFTLPGAPLSRVAPGDVVELSATDLLTCPPTTVDSVDTNAQTLTTSAAPGAGCANRLSVRATGSYVVEGSSSGYMGRVGAPPAGTPTTFTYAGTYLFHPGPQPLPPQIGFTLSADDGASVVRDGQYRFAVTSSGFQPAFITVDVGQLGTGFRLPGAVAFWDRPEDQAAERAFIAFPAADALLQVDLTTVLPNAANGSLKFVRHR